MEILFTDENIFTLTKYPNSRANRNWIPKDHKREYKYGTDQFNVFDNIKRANPKFDKQVMIAAGVSNY